MPFTASVRTSSCPVQPVILDTDPGVDDALAMMLAFASPELRVELITTVAGNVPVEVTTANTRRLLALLQPEQQPLVAQGAARPLRRALKTAEFVHGKDGLGGLSELKRRDGTSLYPEHSGCVVHGQAVQRIVKLADRYRQGLTIIALGPLTNIARAISQAPDTMRRVGRLIIMGGAIDVPGNITRAAEFNLYVDPHAADLVMNSGLPVTLVPLDVTEQVRLTSTFLRETLGGSRTRRAHAVRHMTHRLVHGRKCNSGMAMHDPLAVAAAIEPELVRLTSMQVRVETRGEHTLGMSIAKPSDSKHATRVSPVVEVATEVDSDRMLELFANRVLARGSIAYGKSTRPGVIVVGSANIDFMVSSAHLPQAGETVIGSNLQTTFGGKGANQALAAGRAGARVFFVGKLGRDHHGERYAEQLHREGIEVSGLRFDSTVSSGVALITVDRSGQNQITVAPGANALFAPSDLGVLSNFLGSAKVLVVQLEIPLGTVEAALRQAKAAGLTTVLNPAPARQLPRRIAAVTDILIPNEVEASALTGQGVSTMREARAAAQSLRRLGYQTVIITLGAKGFVWTEENRIHHMRAFKTKTKDSTGAGDTFVGYLGCALAEGKGLRSALELANAASALSVTKAGAQEAVPRRAAAERLLEHAS